MPLVMSSRHVTRITAPPSRRTRERQTPKIDFRVLRERIGQRELSVSRHR